jgi:hypothetical protein
LNMMWNRIGVACAALLLTTAMVTACKPDPRLPSPEIKEAREAIDNAEKAGARRYAQPELQEAEDAFKLAQDAHVKGNEAISKLRSVEAAKLAAHAAAVASHGEAQRAGATLDHAQRVKAAQPADTRAPGATSPSPAESALPAGNTPPLPGDTPQQ